MTGHTKNRCDAALVFIKKKLETMDLIFPSDMMVAINGSYVSTDVVSCGDVHCRNWKSMLARWFTYPCSMDISNQHIFCFNKESLRKVTVKNSTSTTSEHHNLLKRGFNADKVRADLLQVLQSGLYDIQATQLHAFPSAIVGNRHAYLLKEVCQRYYNYDADF